MPWTGTTWPIRRIATTSGLRRFVERLTAEAGRNGKAIAWRGLSNAAWTLSSTLDRHLKDTLPRATYPHCLEREKSILKSFKQNGERYATAHERTYFIDAPGDAVWNTLAIGRHAGLPTRILDWTWSPWVAAYFACIDNDKQDGLLCWFNQSELETVLMRHWKALGVPTIAEHLKLSAPECQQLAALGIDPNARYLSASAFSSAASAWVSKMHYGVPFSRMESQRGFMTVCGRIHTDHNDALDKLPEQATITRGRVKIPARLKADILRMLGDYNIHARSLEYPGMDVVAARIAGSFRT